MKNFESDTTKKKCARCAIQAEMVRNPDKAWLIVLPPHTKDCKVVEKTINWLN